VANADEKVIIRWSFEWWKLAARRIGYGLSFLVVAGVAARVSYGHIRDVVLHVHQPVDVAHLLPLSVDGLMLIATLAMAEDKAHNRKPRGWARWGFWFGAAVSTAANVEAVVITSGWDPLGIAVGASAPVLLLWSIEIVSRQGKKLPVAVIAAVSAAVEAAAPAIPPETAPVAAEVNTPEPVPAPVVEAEADPEPVKDVEPMNTNRRRPPRSTPSEGIKRKAIAPAVRDAVVEAVDETVSVG
jgi:hypothetical protein